jgi:hypothetical protein
MAAMTRTERLWRLKQESKARRPYTCPYDGSGALCPSFTLDRRDTWVCVDCGREFTTAD